MWLIDYPLGMNKGDAALFEQPFEYARRIIEPARVGAKTSANWWHLHRARAQMRAALAPLSRYIVTPEVSKHRVFAFLPAAVIPDKNLIVIARDDDCTLGILHSRFHEAWALRLCTFLGVGNDPRYTPSTTFETFPFPSGMMPNIPAATPETSPEARAIGAAAAELDRLRNAWLNPADLVRMEPEVVPGYPDRVLPRNEVAAAMLAKRTLTNLYNARPAWLANAHAELDRAVAAAYGWPGDISTDEALERLLALNLKRAAKA